MKKSKTFKRALSLLLCVIMVFVSAPLAGLVGIDLPSITDLFTQKAEAATNYTEGYYTYTVSGGKATITDVDESIGSDVTIPSILGGYSVTYIGDCAFLFSKSLESITIPDSVTSIGDSAFYNCENLKSVTIGKNVMSIGSCAFYGCTSLKNISIPNSVTSIGNRAFSGCTSLESVAFGKNSKLTNIWLKTFYNCTSLESITIPDSVTSIDGYAFSGCASLASIAIPGSVTSIADGVFSDCTSLTSITIPDSVTSIRGYTFAYCTSLESIMIPDNVMSIGESAFEGCTSLVSITIPDNVTSISDNEPYYSDGVFSGCTSLESVTFGENSKLTSIGSKTFYNCTSLKNISIPDSVTSIDSSAFSGCTSLESIIIPNSVTSIGYDAFYGCTSLESITIPDSVTSIGSCAFYGCTSLESIIIPNSVTTIGYHAFCGCASIESVKIGATSQLTSIGGGAFIFCISLKSITIPDSVTSIDDGTFCYTSLESITIPDSVTSIGGAAFFGCTSLESITVDSNNKNYSSDEYGVLFNKDKTELIQYPIGNSRTSYTIPNSVTSIGDFAFVYCTSLKNISIPDSVTSIGYGAFSGCTSLESITVDSNNKNYSSDEYGVLFNKDKTELIQYPVGNSRTSYAIPDNVTSIGSSAFKNCTNLESIIVGNNNQKYSSDEYGVLFDKDKTTLIQYPTGNSRTSYALPDGVKYIDGFAFDDCKNLTSISIPDSIKVIYSDAFYNCTSFTDVYYTGTESEWNAIRINNGNEYLTNATIHFNSVMPTTPTDPTKPTIKPTSPTDPEVVSQPSQTSINYGDSIILHVDASKIPAGGRVEWTADNGNFSYNASADGSTCKITPKSSGTTTFTATIYDKDGNAVSSDTQQMKSKAGVWEKIIAFFKNLFGLTKTYPNAFKYIF